MTTGYDPTVAAYIGHAAATTTTEPDTPTVTSPWSELQSIGRAIGAVSPAPVNVTLTVQYPHGSTAAVDALTSHTSHQATSRDLGGGSWHYTVRTTIHGVQLTVFCPVDEPAAAKRERLLRELAELDAAVAVSEVTP